MSLPNTTGNQLNSKHVGYRIDTLGATRTTKTQTANFFTERTILTDKLVLGEITVVTRRGRLTARRAQHFGLPETAGIAAPALHTTCVPTNKTVNMTASAIPNKMIISN